MGRLCVPGRIERLADGLIRKPGRCLRVDEDSGLVQGSGKMLGKPGVSGMEMDLKSISPGGEHGYPRRQPGDSRS